MAVSPSSSWPSSESQISAFNGSSRHGPGGHSGLLTGCLGLVRAQYGPLRRRVRPLVDRVLPGRAFLTLLFTDIVGSTERIVGLGDEPWRMLLGRCRWRSGTELSRYGGHEVDTAGDAFFATFEQPGSGMTCAWAMPLQGGGRRPAASDGGPWRVRDAWREGERHRGAHRGPDHGRRRRGRDLLSATVRDATSPEHAVCAGRSRRACVEGVLATGRSYALGGGGPDYLRDRPPSARGSAEG